MTLRTIIAAALASTFLAGAASARDLVIHAGRLIDGTGAAPRAQVSILIHDDRIAAIQPGFVTPAGAEIVDLSGETVLPGLIDARPHPPGVPSRRSDPPRGDDDAV